jgi:hypothetical protein
MEHSWGKHAAGTQKRAYKIIVRKPEEKYFRDLGIYRIMILKWIFKKHGARMWNRYLWLRIESSDGLLQVQY